MLGAAVNLCHGTHYSDLCYGFNVFWQKYVPVLGLDITSPPSRKGDGRLWGDGFEIETLIHMRVAEEGLRVAEVPSFEHPRIHGVSNLDAFSDGLRVLTTILVERRRARQPSPFPSSCVGRTNRGGTGPRPYPAWRRPSCACSSSCTPSSTAAPAHTPGKIGRSRSPRIPGEVSAAGRHLGHRQLTNRRRRSRGQPCIHRRRRQRAAIPLATHVKRRVKGFALARNAGHQRRR